MQTQERVHISAYRLLRPSLLWDCRYLTTQNDESESTSTCQCHCCVVDGEWLQKLFGHATALYLCGPGQELSCSFDTDTSCPNPLENFIYQNLGLPTYAIDKWRICIHICNRYRFAGSIIPVTCCGNWVSCSKMHLNISHAHSLLMSKYTLYTSRPFPSQSLYSTSAKSSHNPLYQWLEHGFMPPNKASTGIFFIINAVKMHILHF